MSRFHKLRLVLTLLALSGPAAHAQQAYPARSIDLIEAFSGGLSSNVTHLVADRVSPVLGKPFIPNSQPGASGNIGLRRALAATPDGYTFIVGGQWLTTNWALKPAPETDPGSVLEPVASVLAVPYAIVAAPQKGYKTLADLLTDARKRPGALNYAHPGTGTAVYLYVESLLKATGTKVQHIAYKGGGPQQASVLSGETDFGVMSLVTALPHIKSGKFTALAVTSTERIPAIPDVPTIVEAGYPDLTTTTWFALFGPAGLRTDVVDKVSRATREALSTPETAATIASWGAVPLLDTPAELKRRVESEKARWRRVVEQTNLTGD